MTKESDLQNKFDECVEGMIDLAKYMDDFNTRRANEVTQCDNKSQEDTNQPLYSTPSEVIYSEGPFKVLRYNQKPENNTPLLIVPSLINRYYILDLMEDTSFVKFMSENGINVYVLDWGIPGKAQDHLGLDTYIFKWISRAVNKVLKDSQEEKLTLMGYCMGATISAIYASENTDKINGFLSLAAPYDFSGKDPLSVMARELDVDKLVDSTGHIHPDIMQAGFTIAQPTAFYLKMKSLYQNGKNKKRNNTFIHLERWLSDNIPFPKEAYREYIKGFYQDNLLPKGKLSIGNKKIDLKKLDVPVLSVLAKKDNIVPEQAALALHDMVGSEDKKLIEIDAGHIGVIMGRKANHAWCGMLNWIKELQRKEV
ncbi:MAG: hypothetical protein C0601_05665 [Candidatus Muiribacterium halophilum]|uniref:AB hydrolase-1 domain-containing protein n=1 Tax=Muiribacterium halophilum TaxID=2053465 RepID=A0A2N5ZHF5_MUIH1|nr:MAG: hypothetical protein C0601_05665 [Candidatus Muirbacterium halophilum]